MGLEIKKQPTGPRVPTSRVDWSSAPLVLPAPERGWFRPSPSPSLRVSLKRGPPPEEVADNHAGAEATTIQGRASAARTVAPHEQPSRSGT